MKAIYNLPTNTLEQLPSMDKPELPELMDYNSSADYVDARALFSQEMMVYESHIASLQRIPCDPSCREIWVDKGEYEEGKEFEIAGAGDWKYCYQLKGNVFARPLSPPVEQDELWAQLLNYFTDGLVDLKTDQEIICHLKKHFTITKKQ